MCDILCSYYIHKKNCVKQELPHNENFPYAHVKKTSPRQKFRKNFAKNKPQRREQMLSFGVCFNSICHIMAVVLQYEPQCDVALLMGEGE